MWVYVMLPFALQAIALGFDEIYFHHKRGLPKWERIGHPMDTFSYLICLAMIIFLPFNVTTLWCYTAFAIISCLMVTKDEFIHKHHCPWLENWLHALLFILHPITLITAGAIWPVIQSVPVPAWMAMWLDNSYGLACFLYFQAAAVLAFFIYQIIFWNFIWKNNPVLKQ